ncbi:MAG: GatB/YqeY domain-containing protein, partial [Pelolinea sp.]|nr:GatB/YqeY domain-containing protein [Pelolinea sp.]
GNMSIKVALTEALHKAMKEKDVFSKTAIRLALSSIKRAEVDKGEELDDISIFGIIQKEIKTKEETIAEAVKADRNEMIPPLETEILVLQKFLPSELTDAELNNIIDKTISELNATSIKQMGIVMKKVIEEVQGQASNDRISNIVKSILSK